jgi:ADP-ribosylation factor-like protein 8
VQVAAYKTSLCGHTGIPLLVLGNKNDCHRSLGTQQIIDQLQLKVCRPEQACVQAKHLHEFLYVCPQELKEREVCVYSISCKCQNNIDITLEWLTKHAKSG